MGTETKEFSKWYDREVDGGLVDMKFVPGDGIGKDTTREDFAAENNRVNRIIRSKVTVNRPDVF
ncbi:MAG: hypothetical protein A6F72_05575 [Cycloclasticus sp. symbiont of Poecilosclerida sp. N]|nr:MAG: hypothetical protein A6F72_05575 [Cycloclasticus sp. symbiont of Poecilosclerida sp. N]